MTVATVADCLKSFDWWTIALYVVWTVVLFDVVRRVRNLNRDIKEFWDENHGPS